MKQIIVITLEDRQAPMAELLHKAGVAMLKEACVNCSAHLEVTMHVERATLQIEEVKNDLLV